MKKYVILYKSASGCPEVVLPKLESVKDAMLFAIKRIVREGEEDEAIDAMGEVRLKNILDANDKVLEIVDGETDETVYINPAKANF